MKKVIKKEDLRVQKTKQLIKEAFIDLIEIKGYNYVSVSDITKRANINRNTFYLHYKDKEDLIIKLLGEAYARLDKELSYFTSIKKSSMDQISEVEIRWGARRMLRIIEPEIEFYRIVLLDKSTQGYINNLNLMLKKHLANLLNVKNIRSNLIYEYAFSGMFGLIEQWIIYSPTSADETSKIFARLAYNNLQEFKEIND